LEAAQESGRVNITNQWERYVNQAGENALAVLAARGDPV